MRRVIIGLVGIVATIIFATDLGYAGLSGTTTSTITIMQNASLTGNLVCNVNSAPCIVFGAPNISLNLNGHTITGQGNRATCPTEAGGERAIDTDLRNNVQILGPGLIGEFREVGILITGNNSLVKDVVVASTCREGIFMAGSNNDLEHNKVTRSSLDGNFLASIFVTGTGGHIVRHNQVNGSGPVPLAPNKGGQAIFIGGLGGTTGTPSNNNLIEGNNSSGNPGSGIFVASSKNGYQDTTGNRILRNNFFGNVSNWDIFDDNPAGSNTYKDNGCEVSFGADAPPCPNLPAPMHHDDHDGHGDGGHDH